MSKNKHADSNSKRRTGESFASSVAKDIPYATQSDAQKLDIYLPAGGGKPYPVIIWMHPGGFFEGDKGGGGASDPLATVDMKQLVPPMLASGYAVVSVNYRLSAEARFPALIFDVKAAVRWVRANAARYGFNPEKIGAWGSSAGGYLAAMLTTTGGVKELEDLSLGNPEQSSRIIAAVDWYGPTDFLQMDPQHVQLGQQPKNSAPDSPESRLIGGVLELFPEKCKAASPMTYIQRDHPSIYIQHGKTDDIVPYLQSVALAEQLKGAGGEAKVVLEIIENVGHADPVFFTLENIRKTLDFLDECMK